MKKDTNNEKIITAEELFDIMLGVEKLRKFYKAHPLLYFQVARQNGKTLRAMRFIRQYTAIIRAYEKADREIAKANRKAEKAARKAAKQYKREKKKLIKSASCGTKAHHVVFDEFSQTGMWLPVTCWHCASPIYRRSEARVHWVDGDRNRKVYVCAGCHLKLHEKAVEEKTEK